MFITKQELALSVVIALGIVTLLVFEAYQKGIEAQLQRTLYCQTKTSAYGEVTKFCTGEKQ